MAHSSDILLNVTSSYHSRYDATLPEHYASQQDQNEWSQFLPSAHQTPDQRKSWPAAHATYVHPNDQNLTGKFNIHAVYADDSVGNRSTRILGLRWQTFFIFLILLVLVVLAAVLGGIFGSRAATSRSTATASPTAAIVVDRGALKFPSLAVTHTGNNTHMFSLRSDNNSIAHYVLAQSTWTVHGALNLSNLPATTTSLTAISWRYSNADEIRLYYIDEDSQIIELTGRCTSATACEWLGRRVIQSSDVSKTAGLTAVHWGNASSADGDQIRLYFGSKKNSLYEQAYSTVLGGWANATLLKATISEGTGLSSVVPIDVDNPLQRVFSIDESGDMGCLVGEEELTSYDVEFSEEYNLTRPSSFASCLHWNTEESDLFVSVKQISESGEVVEAYRGAAETGAYYTKPMSDCPHGDSPGGAIAAVGYLDDVYGTSQMFVYDVGGAVTECWWHDVATDSTTEWKWTSTLIHT
ncbi:hypothetical protein LTR84_002422 [Exophiala bonariae]|uniref:Fucose-specific lectin n=1 Tax=Exophiala bonariae TaxID=1690606 RepID=A0AAV9N9R9_9EURO|nr:hypothetical protein LTR84_002422 [Exophiala bonariae]